MRKTIHLLVVITILLSGWIATPAYADNGELSAVGINSQQAELPNVFLFNQLGYSEELMVGPFDSSSLAFSLPANLKLAVGSSVLLKFAVAWSGGGDGAAVPSGVGGTLLVYFNNEVIDTILLSGDTPQEKEIFIPAEALNLVDENGRYRLRLFLNADVNCRHDDLRTTLIVSGASQLNLQYEQVAPLVDLTLLPRPIYQPDSILPSSVLVVVPDKPEAFELQAALNIVAGLGSITNGEIAVNLVDTAGLTQEMMATTHLIFTGLANKHPVLQAANFPMAVSGSGASVPQDRADDGIIEIALSPWSAGNVVIYVGGNSQTAVIKASQAFSTGNLVAVEKPDLSLVSTVNPLISEGVVAVDQTFQSLGYPSRTMGLYGENFITYLFYASPDQANSTGAYIDLLISHSDLLRYESTGVTVLLNDEVIGGIRLSEESPVVEQIKLAPGVLRRGMNRLEIFSDIVPFYSCYSNDLLSTWITIGETSNIHMPVSEEKLIIGEEANLRDFPYMFLGNRSLSDLAFVFNQDDRVSWDYASRLAYYIGTKGSIPLANILVAYADSVPDEVLNQYNLLIFGRASTLPVLSKFNDLLPAPFASGSDEAVQPAMLVNYSLLPETSVGYLQMLPSPWNTDRVILAVLGNTPDGIPMAGTTLIQDDLVARLAGNFAVLYADQVVTTDTRLGISKESIISQLPVAVTVTPAPDIVAPPATPRETEARPGWILPLVGVVTLVILVFFVFMLQKEATANRKPKESKSQGEDSSGTLPKEQ